MSTALTHDNLLITQPGQRQIRAAYALLSSSTATEGDLSARVMTGRTCEVITHVNIDVIIDFNYFIKH